MSATTQRLDLTEEKEGGNVTKDPSKLEREREGEFRNISLTLRDQSTFPIERKS